MLEDILKDAKFYAIDSMTIKSSDVIVVRVKQVLDFIMVEQIKSLIKDSFPNNKCVVLNMGAEIQIAKVMDDAQP